MRVKELKTFIGDNGLQPPHNGAPRLPPDAPTHRNRRLSRRRLSRRRLSRRRRPSPRPARTVQASVRRADGDTNRAIHQVDGGVVFDSADVDSELHRATAADAYARGTLSAAAPPVDRSDNTDAQPSAVGGMVKVANETYSEVVPMHAQREIAELKERVTALETQIDDEGAAHSAALDAARAAEGEARAEADDLKTIQRELENKLRKSEAETVVVLRQVDEARERLLAAQAAQQAAEERAHSTVELSSPSTWGGVLKEEDVEGEGGTAAAGGDADAVAGQRRSVASPAVSSGGPSVANASGVGASAASGDDSVAAYAAGAGASDVSELLRKIGVLTSQLDAANAAIAEAEKQRAAAEASLGESEKEKGRLSCLVAELSADVDDDDADEAARQLRKARRSAEKEAAVTPVDPSDVAEMQRDWDIERKELIKKVRDLPRISHRPSLDAASLFRWHRAVSDLL